jgi:hypothetical protein
LFNSAVLDVAIGMIFVFLAVSLATSAIGEGISGLLALRSKFLFQGIKDLLNDQKLDGLAAQIYQHAFVNPRNDGSGKSQKDLLQNAPSYVPPIQFANALLDVLDTGTPIAAPSGQRPGKIVSGDIKSVADAIDYIVPVAANRQINTMLHGIAERAGGDINSIKREVSAWFDNSMDRLSGVYKRWIQLINFGTAFVLAGMLNISAIHVAKVLWQQPINIKLVEDAKGNLADPNAAFAILDNKLSLPIGWCHYLPRSDDSSNKGCSFPGGWDYLEIFIGWLITAAGTMFGAPFWFDLLQRVIRLKAAGPSPAEKANNAAAAP